MTGSAFRESETESLAEWIENTLSNEDDRFTAAKTITRRLGGQWHDDHATVAIWTPQVTDLPPEAVSLEVFTPIESVDPGGTERRSVEFRRERIETRRVDEFTVAAVEGLRRGTRDQLGSLYQLRVEGRDEPIRDPLADSVPFGAFAPAELYDTDRLDETRTDREYFQRLGTDGEPPHRDRSVTASEPDSVPRFAPATNLLELHPGTTTESGTLAGLTEKFEEIGRKQQAGESLTPGETVFAGYNGVQLMPLAPVTENPEQADHWQPADEDSATELSVTIQRPDSINWGYDIVISGFGAVNPSILETGRPDELVELISTLHTLPEPKRVVFDIALGHAEGRATELLPDQFFSGPGMYGMELDYTQPVVRATLLEMQRRKLNFGADGIRVDGAQDFTNWTPERGEWHDDEFLAEMNDLVQSVAGVEYRPWLIYEDGRPWPRQDWELASTYRELIDQHPHAYQWGPVTFAHNTPALLTFWASKWWRVAELRDRGAHWISGVANHDTLRRGSQLPVPDGWEGDPINPYLGDTPRETYREAYDNPATSLLMYGFLPGVPMDFAHANAHAPWAFVRDTEADWHVKVAAEEHEFVTWHVREEDFTDERFFERLGDLGIDSRDELWAVADGLADAVEATVGDTPDWTDTAAVLTAMDTPLGEVTEADIDDYATAWMQDVHEFCTLSNWLAEVDAERARFGRAVREFRRSRPWLGENLTDGDTFDYRHPTDGTVLYYGHRTAPDGEESLLFCANMEGVETTVTPSSLVDTATGDWSVALAAPSLVPDGEPVTDPDSIRGADGSVAAADADEPITLANGEAVVFRRRS